jgi:hypothetical protein
MRPVCAASLVAFINLLPKQASATLPSDSERDSLLHEIHSANLQGGSLQRCFDGTKKREGRGRRIRAIGWNAALNGF